MRILRTVLIFWLPFAAWLLVIHNFSAIPAREIPQFTITYADKAFHILEFFILGVLMIRAFDKSGSNVGLAKLAVLAIIISLCYGAFDELYQRLVPGRLCDIFDFLADGIGAVTGVLLYAADREERRG